MKINQKSSTAAGSCGCWSVVSVLLFLKPPTPIGFLLFGSREGYIASDLCSNKFKSDKATEQINCHPFPRSLYAHSSSFISPFEYFPSLLFFSQSPFLLIGYLPQVNFQIKASQASQAFNPNSSELFRTISPPSTF